MSAKAEAAEFRLMLLRGECCKIADAQAYFANLMATSRSKFLSLGNKVVVGVGMGKTTAEIAALIDARIGEILERIVRGHGAAAGRRSRAQQIVVRIGKRRRQHGHCFDANAGEFLVHGQANLRRYPIDARRHLGR